MRDTHPSIAQHYHERTKYDPKTISNQSRSLDWENQPDPFKEYKIGVTIDLKPFLSQDSPPPDEEHPEEWYAWQRLSRLLVHSYGITAKTTTLSGDSFYLRAAPSAGGLYPAEVYLIARGGTPMLPAGLYHYQPRHHTLVRFWDAHVWSYLQDACFWHPALEQTQLALVTTATFFRSAWRYQARAYRRICLDLGHLLGNVELAGAMTDYRPHLIGGFVDQMMNSLLYLDSKQEGVMAVIALADLLKVEENLPRSHTALAAPVDRTYPEDLEEGELLPYFHQATTMKEEPDAFDPNASPTDQEQSDKYNFPFCLKVATTSAPIAWDDQLSALEQSLLKRRSTRRYSGLDLSLNELKALLDFTYQPQHYVEQGLDSQPDYFDLSLIETFVVVSGVEDLDEGCYYYAPHAQELRQIRFKNFRRELHFLCLGQDLGRDAAAVVFHTAHLETAIARYGDRSYRYLHMDAGHLGQRLNIGAIRLGLGVSGIGGFFDDKVNEVLGIPADEAVLYITTLGRPR